MQYLLLALIAGAFLTVQVGVNNALRVGLGAPIWAAFTSFFVGACALFLTGIATRTAAPARLDLPLWVYGGGLLGAVYVFLSVFLVPRIGAASLTGCVITGQLMAALVVDHFGWLRVPQHPISAGRLCGAILLGVGVYLIRRF